jgi:hypothetical protein
MEKPVKIRAGYDIAFDCFQNVPMVLLLTVHPSRQKDLLTPDRIRLTPDIIIRTGLDPFGKRVDAFYRSAWSPRNSK